MDIKHDEKNQKFILDEKDKSGHLKYERLNSEVLNYQSTFIDEEIRGKGYGKALVKYALDYAKNNNLKILPTCKMVSTYISRNDQYKSLIA